MAEAAGISLSSVQRIWAAHKLQPHRVRSFKRSRDPAFAAKLTDIVGLYLDPPAHAVVLSIDEKSQIQALDRAQPGLPLKPGRCGAMALVVMRHGTTTLFAALNVLDGRVIGCCMQQHRHRHRHEELNDIERAVPAGKLIEAVVDNYGTRKHPKVNLAVVIDLFNRQVVGFAMGPRMTRTLVMDALRMAWFRRHPTPGLIFHSDRGSQYASNDYRKLITAFKITSSMSRKGDCWDNAVTETLFGSLKVERLHDMRFDTRRLAKDEVMDWIAFYNHRRLHSTLGYTSPMAFEQKWFAQQMSLAA